MTALDLLLLMGEYEFVRIFVCKLLTEYRYAERNTQNKTIYIKDSE